MTQSAISTKQQTGQAELTASYGLTLCFSILCQPIQLYCVFTQQAEKRMEKNIYLRKVNRLKKKALK